MTRRPKSQEIFLGKGLIKLDTSSLWAYTRGIFGVVLCPHFALKNGIETTVEAFKIFFSFGRVERLHSILAVAFTSFPTVFNFASNMIVVEQTSRN